MIKRFFSLCTILCTGYVLSGCTTNPATGQQQFTALMSPQQENQVGAQEHEKILKQYGTYGDRALQEYVIGVGQKVVSDTERPDVQYQFFILDSPMVNAFALPGGYIYVTRGLLALANNEAELASVLAHEAGHITGRHSAERYSRSVVTSLGGMILASAIGSSEVSQAIGLGSNLYLKSYSRAQENQADTLGIRYLSQSGYPPAAMADFLSHLRADSALNAKIAGKDMSDQTNYFATHPATAERVAKTIKEADAYPEQGPYNREAYLTHINGMVYGDNADQGLVRDQNFYHPTLGFQFSVPEGYTILNQPSQVVATHEAGTAIIFDMVKNAQRVSPLRFLQEVWLKGNSAQATERITVNGMPAATAQIPGTVNGASVTIRLVAIQWRPDQIVRFQIAMPPNLPRAHIDALKSTTYSFKPMSGADKSRIKPYRLQVLTAERGDTVMSMARKMPYDKFQEDRFRVLNGLQPGEGLVTGRRYKIVRED